MHGAPRVCALRRLRKLRLAGVDGSQGGSMGAVSWMRCRAGAVALISAEDQVSGLGPPSFGPLLPLTSDRVVITTGADTTGTLVCHLRCVIATTGHGLQVPVGLQVLIATRRAWHQRPVTSIHVIEARPDMAGIYPTG